MERIRIDSNALGAVGYDATIQSLEVEFKDGTVYVYLNVPEAIHTTLLAALSKGQYLNATIRGRFPYRRRDQSDT